MCEDGTNVYRIPADKIEDDKVFLFKKWNNADNGGYDQDATEAVNNLVRYLYAHPEWEVSYHRKLGQSFKQPNDVILELFTLWLQA